MAYARRDQATNHAARRIHAISIDNRERHPFCQAERDHAALPVVATRIVVLDIAAFEHLTSKRKVETALLSVAGALGRVPLERHE